MLSLQLGGNMSPIPVSQESEETLKKCIDDVRLRVDFAMHYLNEFRRDRRKGKIPKSQNVNKLSLIHVHGLPSDAATSPHYAALVQPGGGLLPKPFSRETRGKKISEIPGSRFGRF
jgi:hypothetical protein